MSDELLNLTAAQQAERIAAGEVSSTELFELWREASKQRRRQQPTVSPESSAIARMLPRGCGALRRFRPI